MSAPERFSGKCVIAFRGSRNFDNTVTDLVVLPTKARRCQSMRAVMAPSSSPCMLCGSSLVKLFFSYSPPPGIHPHGTTTDNPSRGVDFESFFGRFRVDFESFSSRDSKSTRHRLENDRKTTRNRLPGRGCRWWWGMNPGGWAVAEKQFH